jgi:hypothetical protein
METVQISEPKAAIDLHIRVGRIGYQEDCV